MPNWAYYNEFDPAAAEWLRELMKAGHIAPGEVDERSILDVAAVEISGFTQCHFFAGIGGWSHALRRAGWPDDRAVWTGSPPCQPFSAAGEGRGRDDERHLAPHFIDLVRGARPPVLFGEQVASSAVFGKTTGASKRSPSRPPEWAWIDDLSDRLEAAQYAVGAADIPAAGVGAPHIRQRTFFGAYDLRLAADGLAQSNGRKRHRVAKHEEHDPNGAQARRDERHREPPGDCSPVRLADLHGNGRDQGRERVAPTRDDGVVGDGTPGRMANIAELGRRKERADPRGGDAGDRPQRWSAGHGASGRGVGVAYTHSATGRQNTGSPLGDETAHGGTGRHQGEPGPDHRRSGPGESVGVAGSWRSFSDAMGVCWHTDCPSRDDGAPGPCDCGHREDAPGGYFWDADEGWIDIVSFLNIQRRVGDGPPGGVDALRPGPTDGFWSAADWVFCRDGKWRPVEPGAFPLAHGVSGRVGLLRGYGNAISPQPAEEYIRAFKAVIYQISEHENDTRATLDPEGGPSIDDLLG